MGREGVVNKALLAVGLVDQLIQLMYSYTGPIIPTIYGAIRLGFASLQKLASMTEQAAGLLGAGSLTVIRRSILPQVIPGVLSGSLIVFALSAGAFATPAIIGGRRLKVVPKHRHDRLSGSTARRGLRSQESYKVSKVARSSTTDEVTKRKFSEMVSPPEFDAIYDGVLIYLK